MFSKGTSNRLSRNSDWQNPFGKQISRFHRVPLELPSESAPALGQHQYTKTSTEKPYHHCTIVFIILFVCLSVTFPQSWWVQNADEAAAINVQMEVVQCESSLSIFHEIFMCILRGLFICNRFKIYGELQRSRHTNGYSSVDTKWSKIRMVVASNINSLSLTKRCYTVYLNIYYLGLIRQYFTKPPF